MMGDLLLVLGTILSTASQLRPGGAPIGPGEICLLAWIALMLARGTIQGSTRVTPALSRLLIFWSLFGASLCIGTLTGYVIADVHDTSLFIHDAVAYPLMAAISILSVAHPDARCRLHRVAWLMATSGSAILAVQIAQAWNVVRIGSIDPWYWDRFRGWSDNPNQLAFLCAMLGLLSLHLADVAASAPVRIAAIATAILPIYVGRLTQSDTFSLVLVAAGPIFLTLKARSCLMDQRALSARSAFAWIGLLALPLLSISVVPLGASISVDAAALAQDMAKGTARDTENTAEVRFAAWQQAFDRGLDAGMLGLGPGPHLPIPRTILVGREDSTDQPDHVEHPPDNGTPNFEAHDTLLDIFTQGGLLAVLTLVWLAGTAFLRTYSARLDGLTTMLCGLTIFTTLHLLVRHPIFWLAIAICLVTAERSKPALTRAWSQ